VLRRITEFERTMDDYHKRFGWKTEEVGITGGQVVA